MGKLLRLQKISNRLGKFAGNGRIIANAQSNSSGHKVRRRLQRLRHPYFAPRRWELLGAVTDGLSGDFYLLAVKAVMDALAMASFVKMFGWPSAHVCVSGLRFFWAQSPLHCQFYAKPFLDAARI
jgi:uncharacterized membrane protein YqgA involved in biofilm formation